MADPRAERRGEIARVVATEGGAFELTYVVPALGLRRTVTLDAIEMALARLLLLRFHRL